MLKDIEDVRSHIANYATRVKFVNAIRRAMKSPDYSTQLGAFVVD